MPLPPQLKNGTGCVQFIVTGPVDVIAGFEGYAPILTVKVVGTEENLHVLIFHHKTSR